MRAQAHQGVSAVLVLLLMPVFLAMLGLAIDGAMLVHCQIELDSATAASALAATDAYDRNTWNTEHKVVIPEAEAAVLARQYLVRNMSGAALDSVHVADIAPGRVTVASHYTATLIFMPIFGMKTWTLNASAVASKA